LAPKVRAELKNKYHSNGSYWAIPGLN